MKTYEVLLTDAAKRDLEELHEWIAEHDSPRRAEALLDGLLEVAQSLSTLPDRGACPRELQAVGNRDYRQVLFKGYRLIYRALENKVFIYLIADGRRDFTTLLARRLLRA